jgi:hypothetical protein
MEARIVAMMPSGQIHLYETKSPDPLAREHASHQLDLHMTVLRELQKTYWTANMQYELFAKVRVAMKCLPPSSNTGPCKSANLSSMGPELLTKDLLPGQYSISEMPWGTYLDIPPVFDLGSHGQGHVNAALDFFSAVPAIEVVEADKRSAEEDDLQYSPYQ